MVVVVLVVVVVVVVVVDVECIVVVVVRLGLVVGFDTLFGMESAGRPSSVSCSVQAGMFHGKSQTWMTAWKKVPSKHC